MSKGASNAFIISAKNATLMSMSKSAADDFIISAKNGTLTPEGVREAVLKGISVNRRHSEYGCTALQVAVSKKQRELVAALLEAGADVNDPNIFGATSVQSAASSSIADILQILINNGGSVNEPDDDERTPLIALVKRNRGDAAARLSILLACPELDLDATFDGKTAEGWAIEKGHTELAAAIVEERARRERWTGLRVAWLIANAAPAAHKM